MKLKSFGCSFVFGTDLADDGRDLPRATHSMMSWPALIAKAKQLTYRCYARPGAGNVEILQSLLNQILDDDDDIYLINWTWIDRFSYIGHDHHLLRSLYNPEGWSSIMPIMTDDKAQFYYRHLHSQTRDQMETLIAIDHAIQSLRDRKKTFIMTWTDQLIWYKDGLTSAGSVYVQEKIRPYLSDFDGRSFVAWSQDNGFPISKTMHPLKEAHSAAADLILQNWDRYLNS